MQTDPNTKPYRGPGRVRRFVGDVFWSMADGVWALASGTGFAHRTKTIVIVASLTLVTVLAIQLSPAVASLGTTLRGAEQTPDVRLTRADPPPVRPHAPAPPGLQARLEALAEAYGEPVGVAVSDVSTGWVASVKGSTPFPQQSVSKLWVAITTLDAVDQSRMELDQTVTLWPADRSVFNQPISYRITDEGYSTSLRDLLHRALIQSDNAANDKLMSLVGGPTAVRDYLQRKYLSGIRLAEDEKHLQAHIAGLVWSPDLAPYGAFDAARSRLPRETREAALQAYLDAPYDGATPEGVVQALADLKRGALLSPESTQMILDTMHKATTGPRRLKGGLPRNWTIAHKTGTGQDFRGATVGINDVGLITAPDGQTYAVAVFMARTAHPVPERLAFMQAVTEAVVETWSQGRELAQAQTGAETISAR